ncbi:hypothetical protein F5H01DRAFT_356923 [Linnemannia elongata]|nr:hypothetical protein F5H01DRAFT_356923 [Linnemannia elongata]
MQGKRIIVLVSLALLVSSALADMTPREKWKLDRRFSENEDRPEMIFFRDQPWWEDICEFIPEPPADAELICGYT